MFDRLLASRKRPYMVGRNKREKVEFNFSDNILTLHLPPHSSSDITEKNNIGSDFNIYNENNFNGRNRDFTDYPHQKGTPWYKECYWRTFGFYDNPFLTFDFFFVQCSVFIEHLHEMPDEMTCFNPSHFEQAVDYILYYTQGPANDRDDEGMCDWQVSNYNGIHAIQVSFKPKDDTSTQIFIPLSEKTVLVVRLSTSLGKDAEYNKKFAEELIEAIIPDIQFTPAPINLTKLEAAKEKWPDAKISVKKPPYNWERHTREDLPGGEEIWTLDGSPAPKFTP